jgi:hypothetical protein
VNTKVSVGSTKFRVEAKSMAEASRKFYASLTAKLKKMKEGGLKKIDNSSWIGVGYNIVYGNPVIAPQDGKLVDAGFTTSIFTQSFSKNNKTPDETYTFPDGWDVQPAKVCKTNFSSQTIKTVAKLKDSMNASLGAEGGFGPYSFSANAEYNQMSSSMNSEDKIYISNTATCSVYRAVIDQYNPPQFSKNFLSGLETLKDKPFAQNEKIYYDFIKTFGTHYIYDVMMGSRYTYVVETTNTSLNTMKTSGVNISAQAKYSAMGSIDVKASYKKDSESSNSFDSAVTNKFVTSVGAPMPSSMEMGEWLSATGTVPMPISYSIKPISELLQINDVKTKLSQSGVDPDFLVKNFQEAFDNYCDFLVRSKIIASCTQENSVVINKIESATKFADDGKGDIFFLDRHPIDCGQNSAVNYFKLQRGDGTIRYSFKCVKSDHISNTCYNKETPPQETASNSHKSANYLDRHMVTCDAGQALRSFVLTRNGNKVFYKYSCCVAKIKNCFKAKTAEADHGEMSTHYLDRQEVDAKESNVFNNFHLVSANGKFFYETNICTLG